MNLADYIKLLWLSGFSTSETINYLWDSTGVSEHCTYVQLTECVLQVFTYMNKGLNQLRETNQ